MGSPEEGVQHKVIEKHLLLLKEEYAKLQRSYTELERKYNTIAASINEAKDGNVSNIFSQLASTAASLYGRSAYADIHIKLATKTLPAHKFVFHSRSEVWQSDDFSKVNELNWTDIEDETAVALVHWIYTDIVDLRTNHLALDLLQAAKRFHLSGLLNICERGLLASADMKTCVQFYCIADEVGAQHLLEYCSKLIAIHWRDLAPQDFERMSGPLLYKMLKSKTKFPLHEAIRLNREDVVFLYLVEGSGNEHICDIVNSISDEGVLPLQMALTSRYDTIAQTLITTGKADVNAYDAHGSTMLIRSIENCDQYSAEFLLEHNCDVNLSTRNTNDNALHKICSMNCNNKMDSEKFSNMIEIAKKILQMKPDINLQNCLGQTPLYLAVQTENYEMIDLLLSSPTIDLNLRTNDEQCPLELCLRQNTKDSFKLAERLIQLGADPNQLKLDVQNNLLQDLASSGLEEAAIFLVKYTNLNHMNSDGWTALHIAAKLNQSKLTEKLLEAGASPNLKLSLANMNTPLHICVENDACDVLKIFAKYAVNNNNLKEIPDFNCINANGESPLNLAVTTNRIDLLPFLIRGGSSVNAHNSKGLTLLHQAILQRNSEIAVFLLKNDVNVNDLTDEQKSPLQLAIECHLPEVVDALCSRGVALSSFQNNNCDSPIWVALDLGYEDVAQVLVRHGIDTDCWAPGPDGYHQTLLHRALDENKESTAIFLIRNRCDIDEPRKLQTNNGDVREGGDGASPLHLCCQWGLVNALKALIGQGANVNALDAKNKTPLHTAIENRQEEIVSLLLCHPNINLKMIDKDGNSPFAAALAMRNHRAAERILERLPNAAEQMDTRGRNFLHLAIMKNDLESLLFLLAIQVDVNSRVHDAGQSTPLHLAASSKNEMIIRNLILAEARINERDAMQRTPLHIAVEQNNLSAVSALLQNSADYDALDAEGNNALHIAVRGGYLSIIRELLTESSINAEAINFKGRNPLHELCRSGDDSKNCAAICELFLESMPAYPINAVDMDGNTPLLLAFMRGQAPLCRVLVKNGACLGSENREGINIFNFKLATDKLLYKLLDQLPQESTWAESDICQECSTKFSLTMRKHHCRHCGRVLCAKCSNNDVPILKFGINKPVRVCGVCFDVLQGATDNIR